MKAFETLVGLFVLLLAIYAASMFYSKNNSKYLEDHYTLYADFTNIDGIKNGSPVKISGVTIGSVINCTLQNDFTVRVTIAIESNISLSTDTLIELTTEGIVGNKYLKITPGFSEERLKDNEHFNYTKAYDFTIESVIDTFIKKSLSNDKHL